MNTTLQHRGNGRWLVHSLALAGGAVALACAVGAARAQTGGDASGAYQPPLAAQVQQQGDVRYVHGGIGDDGRERTMQLGRGMNTQLVFAQRNGAYLADVDVTIERASGGEVLSVESADPLLFAELPPGRYRVRADAHGQTVERMIEVPAQGRAMEFLHWQAASPSMAGR